MTKQTPQHIAKGLTEAQRRWIVIGIAICVALLGEQLAAAFLLLGYEVGSARQNTTEDQP